MKPARKIAFYAFIGLGLLVVVIGGFFIRGLIAPAKASVITTSPAPTVQYPPPIHIQGTYANFSIPGSLKPLQGMQGATGNLLAVYNYGKQDIESWHLAIDINQLQEPTLTYDNGYLLRANDPSLYQASTVTYGGNTFIIMTNTQAGDFTEAAFILHNGMSADISLTGNDPAGTDVLANAFRQILQSWHWQ